MKYSVIGRHIILNINEYCSTSVAFWGPIESLWRSRAFIFFRKLDTYRLFLKYTTGTESCVNGMINRVNANDNFNVQEGTSCCILQRTILGLLLFNVSINDMLIFFKACGMCNYANGKTFYMPMREMSTEFKGRQNENLRD